MATPGPENRLVSGDEALAEFRRGLTGANAGRWLQEAGGRLLVALPVGVGKTRLMIDLVRHALSPEGDHDLVVVLVPRRDLLREIRRGLPPGTAPIVLDPRPRRRCGDLDADWRELEEAGCGLLARPRLCRRCPRLRECPWPGQSAPGRLRGARLVLATQQHLALDAGFVGRLRRLAGARRVLVLLDESDLLVRPARRRVGRQELDRFLAAQERAVETSSRPGPTWRRWLDYSRIVSVAPTGDLREGGWHPPRVESDWALSVQQAGRRHFGAGFRFLAHDLIGLGRSDPMSRERAPDGGLLFTPMPDLGDDLVVFSATIAPGLVRFRIDPDHRRREFASPLAGYRFEHPGTRWYNLNSGQGSARHFPRNAPAVLDFFAELIARNIREGRRTLLVARKKFRRICMSHLGCRLRELGVGPVRFVAGARGRADLGDPRTLPLISYGLAGVNRFEGFDSVFCLTGYYVPASALADAVFDLVDSGERSPIRIETRGEPPRRSVLVDRPDERETILPRLARWTFERLEADVVVQAVGRVRPFTRPREVITFHLGELPGVRYTREFRSLAEARACFGVTTRRRSEADRRAAEARRLKTSGLSCGEIARQLGVNPRSVRRYLNDGGGHEPFYR